MIAPAEKYQHGPTKQAAWSRRKESESADIGEIPAVVNPERKESCRLDLLLFLTTYFPNSTGLRPFSEDHKRVIGRIQSCILTGGRYGNVVYRGFAKTTITENSALWAVLYGHRKFVPIFGATDDAAKGNLESIKRELQENDLLCEDFPEVCHAIAALEGKVQRCASQTHGGNPTFIQWTADKIVLPTIAGSVCSGSIVAAHGLTAAGRGMKHKRPDGTQQRPDFVLIDDPQTDESANSETQIVKRRNIIAKSILKMAGHRTSLACVVNGTVIAENDLMDELLDQKKSPAWQSERISMVKSWSKAHDTLWLEQYAKIRNEFDPGEINGQREAHRRANQFYLDNRAAMDEGCVVSWEWCYIEGDPSDTHSVPELSSIQHAYNMLIDDGEDVFASECQNQPLPKVSTQADELKASFIAEKFNRIDVGTAPATCQHVTAMIDVQQKLLFWSVVAWDQNFSGYVLDYGAWPDPGKSWFTLKDAKKTLQSVYKSGGLQAALYAGLEGLTAHILGREWRCDDGSVRRVGKCLIDANWGESTDTVYQFCRQSPFAAVLLPSHGKFYGASTTPISQYQHKPGELKGNGWLVTGKAKRGIRYTVYDTNLWKSFLHERLRTPMGDRGCLSLNGKEPHRLLASHLTSEYRVRVEAKNRVVDEWKLRPDRPDNHWLDTLTGCCVGASMLGCQVLKAEPIKVRQKRKSIEYI